jgi:transcriptional regulator with XRE-family HTH domain
MMDKVVPAFYRCLRKRRNMSQTEFGRAVGKRRAAISKWESGRARPSYEDESLLLLGHDCSWQETLEILSEAVAETTGRPVTILFEQQEPDLPSHPLAIADRRLRETDAQIPATLRRQLQRSILAARANTARTERENGELLQHVEECIAAFPQGSQRH